MTWASTAEVETITGVACTLAQVSAASGVIDLHAQVTEDALAKISARDLAWLKRATAWQTVWQRAQPGYGTEHDITTLQQDGLSASLRDRQSVTLAPLASRALDNLTWRKSRSVRLRTPFLDDPPATVDPLDESVEEGQGWLPLHP